MEFRVLGPLEVRRDGRPVDLQGSKRKAVLALLVLHANEVVRNDRLIEELWGERLPTNALAALQNHVSRLRKSLGADVLVTKPWGYVLRAEPEAVDLQRFEALVAEAKALAAQERRAKLIEALALWRGPALADLSHEPALTVEIARLEELRLSAVEQRIDADLELGSHEELVPELEALVGDHPLRERLRGQLILALYRSGRQAEALETYRETRRLLVEELGIEPSPELRELERAILRQDPVLAAAARPPAEHPPPDTQPPAARWRWPRSPLVVGAVLLLLAGAGAAAGVLATEGGASHRTARTSRSPSPRSTQLIPAFQPAAAPSHATGQPAVRRSKRPVHPAAVKRSAKHQPKTNSRPAAPPPPPPPPPPQPPPPPAAKKNPPPAPKYVYWLADNFHNPAFNHDLWDLESTGTGVDVAERNDRLEFTIAPDSVPGAGGVGEHYGTNCLVKGDFEAVVQYQLLTWPASDGVNIGLGGWVPPPHVDWWGVERAGGRSDGAPEVYFTNLWRGAKASAPTADTRGALRLRRKDGTVSAFYRSRGPWIWMGSRYAPAAAVLVLNFDTAGGSMFGGQAASAAFDNFQATAESVDCPPNTPVPPRKRRH